MISETDFKNRRVNERHGYESLVTVIWELVCLCAFCAIVIALFFLEVKP